MATSASWTTPYDHTTGLLVTAAHMNTYISNNLLWLKSPPVDRDSNIATTNTTSTSFVAITGASLSLTTVGGRVLMGFVASITHGTANANNPFDFYIDGTGQGHATNGLTIIGIPGTTPAYSVSMVCLSAPLSATSHTITVRWRTTAGTVTLTDAASCFWAIELGS